MARMEHLSDEELAQRAQSGSVEAEELLVHRYWKLTSIIARSFRIPGVEIDDKESECLASLVKAIREYRAGKGTKFKTFAKMLMSRALVEVWRDVNAAGEIPIRKRVSLEQPIEEGSDACSMADLIMAKDDTGREVMAVLEVERVASALGVEQRSQIDSVIAGGLGNERMSRAVKAFASAVLPAELAADILDLLRSDAGQPKLIHLFPERGSDRADDVAERVFNLYTEVQWAVLCDVAEGYQSAEIATRQKVPTDVINLMLSACSETAKFAA